MSVPHTRLDPHALGRRILPLLAPLELSYSAGHWTRAGYQRRLPFATRELEAIVSRSLRAVLDEDDPSRSVTSGLVKEVLLALAGMLSPLATRLVEEAPDDHR